MGGGVIGCSIAYYLAQEGVKVTVLDKGEIGSEASRAAAGMLAPLAEAEEDGPFQELGLASLRMFPDLVETLKQECGVDIEYLRSGILRVALTEKEAEHLGGFARRRPSPGLELHWLDPGELRAIEPGLSSAARGALYSPEEHQVNADRLVQALAKAAAGHGADLRQNTRVMGLTRQGTRVTGVRTSEWHACRRTRRPRGGRLDGEARRGRRRGQTARVPRPGTDDGLAGVALGPAAYRLGRTMAIWCLRRMASSSPAPPWSGWASART